MIVIVICDRRVSARVKGKVCKMVVRLVMLYALEAMVLKTGSRAGVGRIEDGTIINKDGQN